MSDTRAVSSRRAGWLLRERRRPRRPGCLTCPTAFHAPNPNPLAAATHWGPSWLCLSGRSLGDPPAKLQPHHTCTPCHQDHPACRILFRCPCPQRHFSGFAPSLSPTACGPSLTHFLPQPYYPARHHPESFRSAASILGLPALILSSFVTMSRSTWLCKFHRRSCPTGWRGSAEQPAATCQSF